MTRHVSSPAQLRLTKGYRDPTLVRSPRRSLLILLLIAMIVLLAPFTNLDLFKLGEPARLPWFVSGLLSLVMILVVKQTSQLDWLAAPVVYCMVFWLFHFGLIFPASIVPQVLDGFPVWTVSWAYYPEAGKAALLSLVFILSFLLGWLAGFGQAPKREDQQGSLGLVTAPELVTSGWLLIGVGLLLGAIATVRYGVRIFFRAYTEFFPIHNAFSWPIIVIAFGLALHLASNRSVRDVIKTGLWAYAPLALLTFVAGARTVPMVTAVVLAMVLGYRGFRLPRLGLWVAAILLLVVIGIVRETRSYGLAQLRSASSDVSLGESPLSGMTELGGSLKPVSATVHYVDIGHNSLFYGETYAYPLIRMVQRGLVLERSAPESDPRFIGAHIGKLYGEGMGFSVVAEAYVNGNLVGIVLFGLLWGLAMAQLSKRAPTAYGLSLLAAAMLPMMINVRNSFIFVPAWTIAGVSVLVFSKYVVKRVIRDRSWSRVAGRPKLDALR